MIRTVGGYGTQPGRPVGSIAALSDAVTAARTTLTGWNKLGNCFGCDPEMFFPSRGESTVPAKNVCLGSEPLGILPCPVLEVCLEHALAASEHHGVWGGRSERERKRIRAARKRAEREAARQGAA